MQSAKSISSDYVPCTKRHAGNNCYKIRLAMTLDIANSNLQDLTYEKDSRVVHMKFHSIRYNCDALQDVLHARFANPAYQ